MTTVSVATIAYGRTAHLANMILGLERQTHLPIELIVATKHAEPPDLPASSFPIRHVRADGVALPLSAARNAAAATAQGDIVIFLDVDCIPAGVLCAQYAEALQAFDGVAMGEVMYLPGGANAPGWTEEGLAAVGVRHSDRRGPPTSGLEICEDYRCFWSLNFAMRREVFVCSGGFDERYVGYGGEDTDFAKTLAMAGVPLAWVKGARAYHQYHPHHMPPIHHLESVVRNAELFETKWGYRTMGHWLYAFRLMGLIDDLPGRPIRILRRPGEADLALTAQQSHQPYSNTATVIRRLEAEAKRDNGATA